MKKCIFVLVFLGLLPVSYANGYEYQDASSQYTATRSGTKSYKKTNTVRKTGGYHNTINNTFYYGQMPAQQQMPVARRTPVYRDYDEYEEVEYAKPVEKVRYTERRQTEYSSQERKYFLAHPFFQPLKGGFGSVTDISYAKNSFKFDLLDGIITDLDPNSDTYPSQVYGTYDGSAKAENTQFVVKEDVSFGLSDTLALVLMAQYDSTKSTTKDWSDNNAEDPYSNTTKSSGVNVFGIGLQDRFVDTDEWIAMFTGFFQHQDDTANSFGIDVKAGYKIDRTTVYGLGRLVYSSLTSGDSYGMYVDDPSGDWLLLSYKTDVSHAVYFEGGAGFFSVLNKYAYVGGELLFGHYDWHNQFSIKGSFGFQPSDSFALNFYASTSLSDSAKNKVKRFLEYDVNPADLSMEDPNTGAVIPVIKNSKAALHDGNYKIKSYDEWKIGVQAIFYF